MPAQTSESEDARQIRAFTLELQSTSRTMLTLPLNPQSYEVQEGSRSSVHQTMVGAYAEEWGAAPPTIRLRGHTGYAEKIIVPGLEPMDGYQGFLALRDMLRNYYQIAQANAVTKHGDRKALEMRLHVWEEDEHWQVVPTGPDALSRSRSAEQPLLFNYALSFTALRRLTEEEALQDNLLGPADPFGASKAVDGLIGQIVDYISQFGGVKIGNMTLAELGGELVELGGKVLAAVDTVTGAANSATAAMNNLATRVRSLQKAVRSVMNRVSRAAAAAGRMVGAAYGFVNTVRELGCVARNLYGWATSGLVNTFSAGWSAARRRKVGC